MVRLCRRCGELASAAARQAEPICSDGGLVGGHSFIDVPDEDAAVEREVRLDEARVADEMERDSVRGISPPDY